MQSSLLLLLLQASLLLSCSQLVSGWITSAGYFSSQPCIATPRYTSAQRALLSRSQYSTTYERRLQVAPSSTSLTRLCALPPSLLFSTALEDFLRERSRDNPLYRNLQWLQDEEYADETNELSAKASADTLDWLPLYPLSATYLPHSGYHTLNNVQPQNIQMALGLLNKQQNNASDNNAHFVVTLQFIDSERLSKIGIMMQLVNATIDYEGYMNDDESPRRIKRIVVCCRALEAVLICAIRPGNPLALVRDEKGSNNDKAYRQCRVVPYYNYDNAESLSGQSRDSSQATNTITINTEVEPTLPAWQQLLQDYASVCSFYVDGIGQTELPHFARDNVQDSLPAYTIQDITSNPQLHLWKLASTWQTLCNTLRWGQQIEMDSSRNEIMIQAAMKKGGPLELPIRMQDLDESVQTVINKRQVAARQEWLDREMDPTLDFVILTSLQRHEERLEYLASMIQRERQRLTWKSLLQSTITQKQEPPSPPSKGAWFE
jgi:hypothetical protein